jgi:hypothetical protein
MIKNCDGEEMDFDILMALHVLSSPEYKSVVFGMPSMSVRRYGCSPHSPEWMDRFYSHSLFKRLSVGSWCV